MKEKTGKTEISGALIIVIIIIFILAYLYLKSIGVLS